MICKVIEGEEEISCPPCHEWNICKTQQRHNHFHFLLKVFSEHKNINILDCKCIFSTCTLDSPHICDICQQHLKRNTLQQQESNLCRFKILVKVCCSFRKPSTLSVKGKKKTFHHRVTVSLWCIFIFVYFIFLFLSLSSCLIECSTKNSHSAHWLCAWCSGAGTCPGDFSNFLLDICWLW